MGLSFLMLLVLLLLVVAFLAATVACIPKRIVKTAPKDIQKKVLARPDYPKWRTALGFVLTAVIALGIAGVLLWAGLDAVRKSMRFGEMFARFSILLCGYKLFDMICFDWLLLTKLHLECQYLSGGIGKGDRVRFNEIVMGLDYDVTGTIIERGRRIVFALLLRAIKRPP